MGEMRVQFKGAHRFYLTTFLGGYTITAISAIMAYVCEGMVWRPPFSPLYDRLSIAFSVLMKPIYVAFFSCFFF